MNKEFKICNPLELCPGQMVFLKTDAEQSPRMVTNFKLDINNSETFGLSCGTEFSWHYAEEITLTKNYTL